MATFIIQEQDFNISASDVEGTALNLEPQPLTKLTHTVVIEGKVFPVRQLISEVTGLPLDRISALDAYKILDKLGFLIQYRK